MKVMAAVCGIMIVLLGFWSTGRNPTEVQSSVQITCLIGGLILCILAVVLGRLDGLAARLDAADRSRVVDAALDEIGSALAAEMHERRPDRAVP